MVDAHDLTGIIKLGDQHPLVEVAAHATLPAIRKRAFGELRDPRALAELIKPKLEAMPTIIAVEVAGPGFLNLRLGDRWYHDALAGVLAAGVVVLTCGTYGNVIRLLPPLVIGEALLTEGLAVLVDAVRGL